MSMGVHHPYPLDLCAHDEDPSQLITRPGWDAPHVRCSPRTFCARPCLLRQVGTVLGSPYDCVVARLAYANPGSRHSGTPDLGSAVVGKSRQMSEESNLTWDLFCEAVSWIESTWTRDSTIYPGFIPSLSRGKSLLMLPLI